MVPNIAITNNSIKHHSFVYTQLNDQTIQFSISHLFAPSLNVKLFYLTHKLDALTLGRCGPGSNGNEEVLCIPQSSSITGASPSDCLELSRGAASVFYNLSWLSKVFLSILNNLNNAIVQLILILPLISDSFPSFWGLFQACLLQLVPPSHSCFTAFSAFRQYPSICLSLCHYYYYYYYHHHYHLWIFHTNVSWWSFTEVWEMASLQGSSQYSGWF